MICVGLLELMGKLRPKDRNGPAFTRPYNGAGMQFHTQTSFHSLSSNSTLCPRMAKQT